MNEKRSKRLVLCFLLSFLIHILLLLLIVNGPPAKKPEALQAQPLDVEILEGKKRLADISKPAEEKRPEKADFVGQYDSTVKEEQVAATPHRPAVVEQQGSVEKPAAAKQRGSAAKPAIAKPTEPEPSPTENSKLAALFSEKKRRAGEGAGETKGSRASEATSFPEDFYPDYKVGSHTYLNVLRFPEVQYFVQLKRAFKMTFNPAPALRPYVFTNQISQGQVEVVLGVEVDAVGRLARLFVIRSSGLGTYDEEALRTVRDSSPFAQPPSKLLDKDGSLRMSWTFTVYL